MLSRRQERRKRLTAVSILNVRGCGGGVTVAWDGRGLDFRVFESGKRPADLHFGAGNSSSVPQRSSHSITRSFEMPWPASNSASPARLCRCSWPSGETSKRVPFPSITHSKGSPTGSEAPATSSSGISTIRVFPARTIRVVVGLAPARNHSANRGWRRRLAFGISRGEQIWSSGLSRWMCR